MNVVGPSARVHSPHPPRSGLPEATVLSRSQNLSSLYHRHRHPVFLPSQVTIVEKADSSSVLPSPLSISTKNKMTFLFANLRDRDFLVQRISDFLQKMSSKHTGDISTGRKASVVDPASEVRVLWGGGQGQKKSSGSPVVPTTELGRKGPSGCGVESLTHPWWSQVSSHACATQHHRPLYSVIPPSPPEHFLPTSSPTALKKLYLGGPATLMNLCCTESHCVALFSLEA